MAALYQHAVCGLSGVFRGDAVQTVEQIVCGPGSDFPNTLRDKVILTRIKHSAGIRSVATFLAHLTFLRLGGDQA